MPQGPEDIAREQIDRMLVSTGWAVQDAKAVNLYAIMTPMMKESIDRMSPKLREVVLFMRSVKFRSFFEQMKGRGVRHRNRQNNYKTMIDCVNLRPMEQGLLEFTCVAKMKQDFTALFLCRLK